MLWLLAKMEPANCKDLNVVAVHYACSSRITAMAYQKAWFYRTGVPGPRFYRTGDSRDRPF